MGFINGPFYWLGFRQVVLLKLIISVYEMKKKPDEVFGWLSLKSAVP